MGYKVLVTIDLPDIDSKIRDEFYNVLKEEKWNKIESLTTAWKVSFKDDVTREGAISTLESDLKKAKEKSKAKKVEYAIQMDKVQVTVKRL